MRIIHTREDLREQLDGWRREREHVAIVPTMGALHAGHISLVELAREHAERIVVTVFVNPTQFGEDEDFAEYPRSLERDARQAKRAGGDLMFAPDVDTVYPVGVENATTISVPGLSENFCGSFRPGHFDGVTTVVARLFAMVQPDVAIFGQKDYQQQIVIRRMVEDLSLPIRIVTAATVRDDDGLALSSRNAYLNEDERAAAPMLYRTLCDVAKQLQDGKRNFDELEAQASAALETAGFEPEYVAIRRALDLTPPNRDCDEIVILSAARLGKTRLIDNVVVTV
ncbi:MAG: pantoate--beta-alanine ligase [Gammaproteobacteria bacterium]|nr:pantoate--beta-alanine ligase [Gammaproteobacteria bacterium]MDH3431002.1 pantoate--beta-alanine ligase [Gammaproteobacteria bacterium]MDH3433646.1 pantoate--beta-alanine ligase [Gammaproteobacteria bacterium]